MQQRPPAKTPTQSTHSRSKEEPLSSGRVSANTRNIHLKFHNALKEERERVKATGTVHIIAGTEHVPAGAPSNPKKPTPAPAKAVPSPVKPLAGKAPAVPQAPKASGSKAKPEVTTQRSTHIASP